MSKPDAPSQELDTQTAISEVTKRVALMVGVNNSVRSASLPTLKHAESDASKLAQAFSEYCGFEMSRPPLLGQSARSSDIKQAILELASDELTDQDVILFYFSGHGQPMVHSGRKDIYLVTHDFNEREAQRDQNMHMSLRWLWQNLYQYKAAGSVIIILDCCYAGNIGGLSPDPLQIDIRKAIEDSFDNNNIHGEGLKDRSRSIITAAGYNQTATEGAGHGLMSGLILSALPGSEDSALDRDGNLSLKSLHGFLEKQYALRQQTQIPYLIANFTRPFILARYPERSQAEIEQRTRDELQRETEQENKLRLQAMLTDHSGFLRDRLSSFVGRKLELEEIHQRINERLKDGGYVTITGQAGQGKSSLIAKLVEEFGFEDTAYHFIPFNPGPDHQISLLRNLMARLILKYNLPDVYVASESRPALRDFFPKLLAEAVAQGGREVIFIDGLDQLQEDPNGERDLSFLPNNLPAGVVCVLGTRPNDTLKPLELLKPHHEYRLPNLTRSDFDLILHHRGLTLDKVLADRFYTAMQANALYLDLVAKELADVEGLAPETIIQRLTDNPENIFSLTMGRLKRQRQQWNEVIKPTLGLLLAAREPLGQRAIRDLLGLDGDIIRDGLQRLGGLLAQDGQGRYQLFHLKLRDYLRQDEQQPNRDYVFDTDEEEKWHARLAAWCEITPGGLDIIWENTRETAAEQERRKYAREHFITHIYTAKNWEKLWEVLDTGSYGKAKLQYDPSTRSYAYDLYLGCRAATHKGFNAEEQLAQIPRLWRYVLLRCSLVSKIRYYPEELFTLLVLKQRENEAIELVELLSTPVNQAIALCRIAQALGHYSGRVREALTLLQRAENSAYKITDKWLHEKVFRLLTETFAGLDKWDEAVEVAYKIGDSRARVQALALVAQELASAGEKERFVQLLGQIEKLTHLVGYKWEHENTLYTIREILDKPEDWKGILDKFWQTNDSQLQGKDMVILSKALIGAGLYEAAQYMVYRLDNNNDKIEILLSIVKQQVKSQHYSSATPLLAEALEFERAVDINQRRVDILISITLMLSVTGKLETALRLMSDSLDPTFVIADYRERVAILIALAEDAADFDGQSIAEQFLGRSIAKQFLLEASAVSHLVSEPQDRSRTLKMVADAMARLGEEEAAAALYLESGGAPLALFGNIEVAFRALWESGKYRDALDLMKKDKFLEELVQKKQWDRAITIARDIEEPERRVAQTAVIIRTMRRMGELALPRELLTEALKTARTIFNKKDRVQSLVSVAEVAAEVESRDTVIEIFNEIIKSLNAFQNVKDRAEIYYQIALSLAKVKVYDSALSVSEEMLRTVNDAGDRKERYDILRKVSKVLAQCRDLERLLLLLQRYWLQAVTRDEAIQLLPMISGLIVQMRAESSFIKSFPWVDNFLKIS